MKKNMKIYTKLYFLSEFHLFGLFKNVIKATELLRHCFDRNIEGSSKPYVVDPIVGEGFASMTNMYRLNFRRCTYLLVN